MGLNQCVWMWISRAPIEEVAPFLRERLNSTMADSILKDPEFEAFLEDRKDEILEWANTHVIKEKEDGKNDETTDGPRTG